MDKNEVKKYWTELYQESLQKTLERLDIKGERMKLIIQVVVGGLLAGLVFALSFLGIKGYSSISDSIYAAIIGTVVTALVIYLGLRWASRFIAFGNIFRLAAEHDDIKSAKINSLERKNKRLQKESEWIPVNLSVKPDYHFEHKTTPDNVYKTTIVRFAITNNEKSEITDCYVTLESAEFYKPSYFRPLLVYEDMRLRWENNNEDYSKEACKNTIPAKNKVPKYASLWSSDYRISGFTFCKPNDKIDHLGVYVVTIRVDGKYKGKDIKPVYFYGYLYAEVITTTKIKPDGTLSDVPIQINPPQYFVLLEEGDWEYDERIPVARPAKDE